jgi:hypothetical protein
MTLFYDEEEGSILKISPRRIAAAVAIAAVGAIPLVVGSPAGASPQPVATISCTNARTPGGVKCLQAGEFCSHKPGYAAAYRRAGYRCNSKGRLEER